MRWEIQRRMAWQVVADKAVMVDLDEEVVAGLNEVGTFVWQCLHMGGTREDLVSAVTERYGISRPEAERDIDGFVSGLEARGWIEARVA